MSVDRRAVDAVEAAVDHARKKLLRQLGLREALLATAVALIGPTLLLLFGTERFPTALLWAFTLGGAAWAVSRIRSEAPSGYAAAQELDERGRAHDQISTAYYFREESAPEAARQRELALGALPGDAASMFPLEWPRTGWFATGILLFGLILLVLRISVMPTLSFKPPLAPLLFPSLTKMETEDLLDQEIVREDPEETAEITDSAQQAEPTETAERPEPLEIPMEAEGEAPAADDAAFEMPEVEGLSLGEDFGDELTPEGVQSGEAEGEAAEQGEETENGEAGEPDESGDWSEESNNLLDRLKDAFENMMESLSMDPPEGQQGEPQSGEGEQSSESQSEGGEQAQADAPGDQASGAEMEGGEQAEGAPEQTAQGQGASDSEQGGQQGESASASGSAEGSKEIEEAMEREAALDALEEFFQERSEQVAGEITIETSEAEQNVVTPYRETASQHADQGGAVTRDEIPLAYQRFIENYFRNLREQEPQ